MRSIQLFLFVLSQARPFVDWKKTGSRAALVVSVLAFSCYRGSVDRVCTFEEEQELAQLAPVRLPPWDGVVRSVNDCPNRVPGGSGCPCCNAVVGGDGVRKCDLPPWAVEPCVRCEAARDGRDGGNENECVSIGVIAEPGLEIQQAHYDSVYGEEQ